MPICMLTRPIILTMTTHDEVLTETGGMVLGAIILGPDHIASPFMTRGYSKGPNKKGTGDGVSSIDH